MSGLCTKHEQAFGWRPRPDPDRGIRENPSYFLTKQGPHTAVNSNGGTEDGEFSWLGGQSRRRDCAATGVTIGRGGWCGAHCGGRLDLARVCPRGRVIGEPPSRRCRASSGCRSTCWSRRWGGESNCGIPAVALFPATPTRRRRSAEAEEAFNPENLVCRAVRAIKSPRRRHRRDLRRRAGSLHQSRPRWTAARRIRGERRDRRGRCAARPWFRRRRGAT